MRIPCSHIAALVMAAAGLSAGPTWNLRAASASPAAEVDADLDARALLALPAAGTARVLILTSNLVELTQVIAKPPDPARMPVWDYVDPEGRLRLPAPTAFVVRAGGRTLPVSALGFKRRVAYAPLARRDLRVACSVFLQLGSAVADGEEIAVTGPGLPGTRPWLARFEPRRWSPAIHGNQVGYAPGFSKHASVGYYLGSLGEMKLGTNQGFEVIENRSGKRVFAGRLQARRDVGYAERPPPYQNVWEADFSAWQTAGEYRLAVPGLGVSLPFWIHEGMPAAWARAYALGLYHQRCGTNNALPYTRFVHDPCHRAMAEVPDDRFTNTVRFLAEATEHYTNEVRHVAPRLQSFSTSRYPFVRTGRIDVSGGHHDAGDYSKYGINSAALIHILVYAADVLPGVGALDNLGIPESGDGRSDVLQEAKWEADFLQKMQDDDGGFFFLVYPRERKYENNVLPENGDPQIVWPKNTAVTAAGVAALAQCAGSPLFRKQFPESARKYLESARRGWEFLERAWARFGRDGAYQKLTHYGDDFLHDDELAWAACELFGATGEEGFHRKLLVAFDPLSPAIRRWGWWRLYEGYGRAIRSYAGLAASGRLRREQLNRGFVERCEAEVLAAGEDQLRWSELSAYGTSFPTETKRFRGGGWYFSMDQAFDLAAAMALEVTPAKALRPRLREAMLRNLNYSLGNNPVNVCYLAGFGWKRPYEIVHHYAMNDRRALPPSGLPFGDVQAGFMWVGQYKGELGALSFPSDGDSERPFPIYDRWGDTFNVQTEFVVVNQARALAVACVLMAQTGMKDQPWRPGLAEIHRETQGGKTRLKVVVPQQDITRARVLWEAEGQGPVWGETLELSGANAPGWVEVEAQWPDGYRVFGATNLLQTGNR
jgi:hypothetical protein